MRTFRPTAMRYALLVMYRPIEDIYWCIGGGSHTTVVCKLRLFAEDANFVLKQMENESEEILLTISSLRVSVQGW